MTAVYTRTLLQTAERQKPKGSLRSSGQRIVTRTSRLSLTSCRTSELTGSLLPFLSPYDTATLGRDLIQIYLKFPTEDTLYSIRAPLWTQWRHHRAGLSSFSDRYFCHFSDKSFHTWSSKWIRMSLYCHYLAQTDVNTQTLCKAFGHKVHYAFHLRLEYRVVTITDLHLHLVSRIFSSWSTHSTLRVSLYPSFLQSLCPSSTS